MAAVIFNRQGQQLPFVDEELFLLVFALFVSANVHFTYVTAINAQFYRDETNSRNTSPLPVGALNLKLHNLLECDSNPE